MLIMMLVNCEQRFSRNNTQVDPHGNKINAKTVQKHILSDLKAPTAPKDQSKFEGNNEMCGWVGQWRGV